MNAKPSFFRRARPCVIAAAFVTVGCGALQAQLFDELQALYGRLRIPVGDPEINPLHPRPAGGGEAVGA